MLPMKADDTYLQLKKDLEYLDLKVSDNRGLASFGHFTFVRVSALLERSPSPRHCRSYQIRVPNEDVCCLNQKSFISCGLQLWAQFFVDAAMKSLAYRMRAQDSALFLSLIKTKRFLQRITGCFFRTSNGVGVSLVLRVPLISVFSCK